ncbi:apolipoprotein N-acyltransferase [Geotalea toluenoxydans]|uniref:apolipoprotein N-acyltransferase n=1 Tax=Geotalea toluenoxydans TaxID=421624 RepID=UPI0006CF5354|nr:apolipoprotein N-acyltransferase [Geotalea toluenoxydans]
MNYSRFHMPDFNAAPRRDYLLAVVSGILLALSFPKPGLSICVWFAFVPLFLAVGKKDPKTAFRLGFICGLTAYGGILYWVNIVMTTYGKLPLVVSFCLYLLLSAYIALYVGIIAYLVNRGEKAGISSVFSFPFLWVGFEFIRAFVLTGFPWASLGHSQYRTLPLIQISDVTGVYGVSFLIALANIIIYRIIKGLVRKEAVAYPARSGFIFLVLMALTIGYGFYRLNQAEQGEPLKVVLVQGNIPQDVKWDPAFQESTVGIYERLTRKACASGGTLVVWPESALPFYFQTEEQYAARVRSLAAEMKSCLVVGSPAFEKKDEGIRYLNSAFLLSPSGEVLGRSDKMHLVPFGEYVPLQKLFPFVNKLVAGIGDFSPGSKVVPLNTGKGEIGVLICFEGIFPELAREYVRAGSRLLVNITNDAWFGKSSAPYQHLSMTVFRAVENRVPLVRAANTGISSVIDSKGHIRGMTTLFKETFLSGEVRFGMKRTIYNRFGDVFAWSCLLLSVGMIVRIFRKKIDG